MNDRRAGCAAPAPERRVYALLALAAFVAYVYTFATFTRAHTALPYFDQANYLTKVYSLADAIREVGPAALVDPHVLLGTEPRQRAPLLPLAAALLLGHAADPRHVALLWLALRFLALLLALALLARRQRSWLFVPAALMLVLASPSELTLNPNLYMMDQAFECFGLLAFALLLDDFACRGVATAVPAAAGLVVLCLVKPVAVVYLAPVYVVLAVDTLRLMMRALVPRSPADGVGHAPAPPAPPLWRWLASHALAVAGVALLATSAYGAAVREQYAMLRQGYWWRVYTPKELAMWAGLLVPPWLLVLAGASLVRHGRRGLLPGLLACSVTMLLCWFAFNTVLTSTIDARVIATAGPIGMAAAMMVACRSRPMAFLATIGAATVFAVSLGRVNGWLEQRWIAEAAPYVNLIPQPQRPVPEVGLLRLAREASAEIAQREGSHSVPLTAVMNDEFVECGALALAFRRAAGDRWSAISVRSAPWGSEAFDLAALLEVRWFLTKERRKAIPLSGDVWTALTALDRLISDPQSPLWPSFEPSLRWTVRQPDLLDEVTLWRLKQTPSAQSMVRALRWVEPGFRSTAGHAAILRQIEGWESRSAGSRNR